MKYKNWQIECWNKMFLRFVAYKEQHGNTNKPKRLKPDSQLGRWIEIQRNSYKKETISKHRGDCLNYIGFVWEIDGTQWMKMYQRLVLYKQQHMSTSVPKGYKADPTLVRFFCLYTLSCINLNDSFSN